LFGTRELFSAPAGPQGKAGHLPVAGIEFAQEINISSVGSVAATRTLDQEYRPMNHRVFILLAGFGVGALSILVLVACRRNAEGAGQQDRSLRPYAESSPAFLDSSRTIHWTSAGFSIPNYSSDCPIQPSLAAGPGAASGNATAIQNALNSCTSTRNVVSIPAGTWYVTGINFGKQGKQLLRGAGPKSTTLIPTAGVSCSGGVTAGICMKDGVGLYNGSSQVLPPSGSNQCLWTGGLTQGSTTITLSSCGGAPPVNQTIILDQANDSSDTSGIYVCDANIANCGYQSSNGGNNDGRSIGGVTHSQQQMTYVTGVTSQGSGSYTVTISPGVYFTNIRASQSPGAWWPGMVRNDGLEAMTIVGTSISGGSNVGMYDCYQCWIKNVNSQNAGRNHVMLYQSANDVIRDSYFYESQSHYSESYVIEAEGASAFLVENNIFQQVTNPTMFGQASGAVVAYNLSIGNIYSGAEQWMAGSYSVHNAGNEMNLFEGNSFNGLWADDAWGSSDQITYFRNMFIGWQSGDTNATFPIMLRANDRAFNIVGNVLGQPVAACKLRHAFSCLEGMFRGELTPYHTQYQTYATSTSGGTGADAENASIYSLGWGGTGPVCSSGSVTTCDPLVYSTLMRWGNWDVVNDATQWNPTEASPAAVRYIRANFTPSYFSTLAHALPASLYYSSRPSWWPSGKAWPPIGPDVSSGNVGVCASDTYAGTQATAASQCGTSGLTTAWASHVTSIPAQDCYLSKMGGPPDGSGGVLSFDANACYSGATSASGPASPAGPGEQ
jgi:hypothetical protein